MKKRKVIFTPQEETRVLNITINNRNVEVGTELRIEGMSGRYKFMYATDEDTVTVYGGKTGYGAFRTFRRDRVKVVHVKRKMR